MGYSQRQAARGPTIIVLLTILSGKQTISQFPLFHLDICIRNCAHSIRNSKIMSIESNGNSNSASSTHRRPFHGPYPDIPWAKFICFRQQILSHTMNAAAFGKQGTLFRTENQ